VPATVTEQAADVERHLSVEPVVVLLGSSNFASANTTERAKFGVSNAGATTTGTSVGSGAGVVGVVTGGVVTGGVVTGGLIRLEAALASEVPTPFVAVTVKE
jgi:hypothetical protein